MENEVAAYVNKHRLLHQNATVLVGVSGGPDSMALLHFLCAIRDQWNIRVIALSVDHGLREEQSRQDVRYVKKMCEQWGVQFCETYLNVSSYKEKERKGTQLAAREMRYQFFAQQMRTFNADYLALGHHADDQAETMLMRFVRGTNPDAIAGIPVKRQFEQGYIIRPFLSISKQQIEAYCQTNRINPRRDPSNQQDTYTRNYYRIHVLPLLKRQNPNILASTQRLSEAISQDVEFLNQQAQLLVDSAVVFGGNRKEAALEIERFIKYPIALQRRAFHLILNYLYLTVPADLHYIHEDYFFHIIHNEKPNVTIDFPKGLKLVKSYGAILFQFEAPQTEPFKKQLNVPGFVTLPNGSTITATISDNPGQESKDVYICEFERIRLPLIVRTRTPGDKMKIRGMNGSKKIKDIFIDEKIPKQMRDTWPIVLDEQENILWLVGLKKGFMQSQTRSSGRYLQIHFENTSNV